MNEEIKSMHGHKKPKQLPYMSETEVANIIEKVAKEIQEKEKQEPQLQLLFLIQTILERYIS